MLCLVTRIRVEKLSTLAMIVVSYLRMRQRAKHVPGLLLLSFRFQPRRTVLFISLWRDGLAMAEFNTAVPEHPLAVYKMRQVGADVWSGLFRFVATSPSSAKSWPDIPVRAATPPPPVRR